MKRKLFVLEDNPLVIMLYELWCKKFGITLILYKKIDQLYADSLPSKHDFCLLDFDLLKSQGPAGINLFSELNIKLNCIVTSDLINSNAETMNIKVKTTLMALESIEALYLSKEQYFRDSTFS